MCSVDTESGEGPQPLGREGCSISSDSMKRGWEVKCHRSQTSQS
jgi:hypothetical protein